jgi:hypothetical protein
MKQIFSTFCIAVLLTIVACKDKNAAETAATGDAAVSGATTEPTATPSTGEVGTLSTSPNGSTGTTTPTSAEPTAPAAPVGPTTTIEFTETTYDFGTVKEGEKVTHSYKFKNTGKEPLIISNAKGSCGCTVPEWPREPIAPGKTGEIKVVFDSSGKGTTDGQSQSKRVTLTANTDPVDTYLNIKGIVKKDPAAAGVKK